MTHGTGIIGGGSGRRALLGGLLSAVIMASAATVALGEKGDLRLVQPNEGCRPYEKEVTWNKEGQPGIDGQDGQDGEPTSCRALATT